MLTEKFLLSLSWFATLTGGILISRFLAQRLPDLLRRLRRRKNKAAEGGDIYTQTREFCSRPYTNVGVGKMDTNKLVVGQKVWIFGCGWSEGTVVRLLPNGVEVESGWGPLAQFDSNGNETDDSRYRRLGCLQNGPGPEWEAWELRERDRKAEEVAEAKAKEARDAWCEKMFSSFYLVSFLICL